MFVANPRPNLRLQVLSWEPNPLTAALLRRSLVLNCWHHIENERVFFLKKNQKKPKKLDLRLF